MEHFPHVPLPPHSEFECKPVFLIASRNVLGSSTEIRRPDGSNTITYFFIAGTFLILFIIHTLFNDAGLMLEPSCYGRMY